MGWLLPLGSHKVMGSFAGYSVSVSTFEIVRLFFNGIFSMAFSSALLNGFFFRCCDLMDCFFGPFFFNARGLRTVHLAHTVQLFLCLKTSWMSFFWLRPCLLFWTPEDFFLYDQPEAVLFFPCTKKTCDV